MCARSDFLVTPSAKHAKSSLHTARCSTLPRPCHPGMVSLPSLTVSVLSGTRHSPGNAYVLLFTDHFDRPAHMDAFAASQVCGCRRRRHPGNKRHPSGDFRPNSYATMALNHAPKLRSLCTSCTVITLSRPAPTNPMATTESSG